MKGNKRIIVTLYFVYCEIEEENVGGAIKTESKNTMQFNAHSQTLVIGIKIVPARMERKEEKTCKDVSFY